jgi:hypothetical protein
VCVSMTIRNGRDKVAPSNIYRHSLTKMVGSTAIAPWTFLGVFLKIFCHPPWKKHKKKTKKKNQPVESSPVSASLQISCQFLGCRSRRQTQVVIVSLLLFVFFYVNFFTRCAQRRSCSFVVVECVLDIWVTKK